MTFLTHILESVVYDLIFTFENISVMPRTWLSDTNAGLHIPLSLIPETPSKRKNF